MRKLFMKIIGKIHEITKQNLKIDSVKIDSATGISYLLISIQGKSSADLLRLLLEFLQFVFLYNVIFSFLFDLLPENGSTLNWRNLAKYQQEKKV
ncbi:hypothetical protein [Legionella taurinensis]|uniref:hypothetical protein n=1 Tax=Legionella taurinensis TaxID=70611 RepID=UPI00145AC73B|nr:hypothetical protein [Legionella taurinensis]MDX1838532.1 hypothetical protein [Legionella taurinensis]